MTLRDWVGTVLILGNHDRMFLDAIADPGLSRRSKHWLDHCGGSETARSYRRADDFNAAKNEIAEQFGHHIDALSSATLMLRDGPFIACHAGINSWLPLDQQSPHDLMWITDGFLDRVDPQMVPIIHGHSIMGELPVYGKSAFD